MVDGRRPCSLGRAIFGLSTQDRRRSSRGFTFVELLVTMLLISIFMPVAMRGISLCTQLAGQSRKEVEAASLAKSQLTELVATSNWASAAHSGDFGPDWPGYKWDADVMNWTDGSNVSVREVDLAVTWQAHGRPKKLTLSTLVYLEGQ